jgi:hypothetical protein
VAAGGKAAEPALAAKAPPSNADAGLYRDVITWYTEAAHTTAWDFDAPVTKNLDLYTSGTASPIDLSGQTGDHTLAKALAWIKAQTLSVATNYTILLDAGNYTLSGTADSNQGNNITTENAVITLLGRGPAEISCSSNGFLFYVTAGELVLDNNITLKGHVSNTIAVSGSSAFLTMKAGAKITGNSVSMGQGGGVIVSQGGSFTMTGGEISDNSAAYGGGVYVSNSGSFTMNGGKISGNSTSSEGGGVCVFTNGSFTMNGGEISGNNASSGGGVAVYYKNGSFTMNGGEISGNNATGSILSNGCGGGVYVYYDCTFTMSGGEISGNSARIGGGVSAGINCFSKTGGGVIYGSNTIGSLRNTATYGNTGGHAVYVSNSSYRDTTLNAGDNW